MKLLSYAQRIQKDYGIFSIIDHSSAILESNWEEVL